ncbi:type I inositol 1,4,5-trisphosphate 5-phosphatase 13-like protein [Carex littledalei]|uniref:Type I inositol 1,4,5-trisphosphate 5-phosphatase 13-like protein n=1 Tax=Carex littledalei TaxID=544730 RepID=A0A833VIA7_9POAL|nr:type I inositol 1,4,5-trisphosphate 5-phosphatase 13-like protein [Carex littledalei]
MSQWPPPAVAPAAHPEEDDWSFLTDQFISVTSLSSSPPPPPHSTNPFLTPPPSVSSAPSLSVTQRSASLSEPAPIRTASPAGPHRSASLSLSDPPSIRSAPSAVPERSDSLSSDSGYWTPPSEPYRSASSLSFSPSAALDNTQWAPPPGPQHAGSLPELPGRVTSDTIFQPAFRAVVDPARPVPLTIRPRPPRESQRGFALKSIVFFPPSHLWAGHESGLRVCNVDRPFDEMLNKKGIRRGDEESAPFIESTRTAAVVSLLVDTGRGVVWSGHIDGRIIAWRADGSGLVDGFMDCGAWDAHQRVPVLSMVLTSYGELWSGSEGGVIKVWSAEAIKECLSLQKEEKHKATFLLERTCIDLRTLVSDGGSCPLPVVDIKLLLSDNSGSKVWSGGYLSFALWDCRTKELLKVISSIDGQAENRFDLSPQDPYSFKKEKPRGPTSFFQRSRNAIMGAADTFKRVAVKAAFGDDIRRVEAVAMSAVGSIWAGSANGAISQWDPSGHRLNEFQHNFTSVVCICAHGARMWVGYSDGTLQIMDPDGKLLASWVAHKSSIMKMAVGGTQIFTLAHHGGIRGWSLSSPGPIDSIVRAELTHREAKYKRLKHFKVVTGTWNVGQEKASNDSIRAWLGVAVKEEVELVVVGLQEVDMGAGFLAMAAAKETVGFEGSPSPNGEWWLDAIERVLGRTHFERVGCRQFASLLIAVWAKKSLKQYIGDVESAAVACGLGRAIANKGGVGFRMRIYGSTVCFVNCHLAAHLEGVIRRNEDFEYIYRSMTFTSAANASSGPIFRGANVPNKRPDLSETDMVVFLGDFNYRLDGITYEEAMALVYQKDFDRLRQRDQLRAEMHAGRVFQGLREGSIKFPATYKFEKYISGLSGYDSSEKKRIPAWCDRILYRDSRTTSGDQCSLDCPVVSSISLYDSCMEATDSDHKPVKCILNVDIAHVDERVRRREFGEIISTNTKVQGLMEELKIVPDFSVSTDKVNLHNEDISVVRVVNKNKKEKAVFDIFSTDALSPSGEHQYKRGFFPKWLKVNPTSGIINPGQTVEVNIQHSSLYNQDFYDGFSGNRQNEENGEKMVILVVKITSNHSTEAKTCLVNVRYTCSNGAFASRNREYSRSGYRDDFRV